jgi:hypothetical protein
LRRLARGIPLGHHLPPLLVLALLHVTVLARTLRGADGIPPVNFVISRYQPDRVDYSVDLAKPCPGPALSQDETRNFQLTMDLRNKSILITGADGFIGSHLAEMAVREAKRVRALALYNSFNSWGWLEGRAAAKSSASGATTGRCAN